MSRLPTQQFAGLPEHRMEHRLSQSAGEGILLAGMVGPDQSDVPGKPVQPAMTEGRKGGRNRAAQLPAGFQVLIEGGPPQRDHHTQILEQTQFFQKVWPASVKLLHAWLVARRGTAHGRRDIAIRETQTVVSMGRTGLIREAEPMERFVEPVTATVPGENPTGSIAAVGCRREAHDQETSLRVAEPWHWASPIGPVPELPAFRPGDRFPMGHQSRAPSAGCDLIIQDSQIRHGEPV